MRRAVVLLLALTWAASATASPEDLLILPESDARFSMGSPEPVSTEPWWLAMGDDTLTRVIEVGIAANPDAAAADARVAQASGVMWQQRAGMLPTVSADANGSFAPLRTLGFQFGANFGGDAPNTSLYYVYGVGVGAQYNVDLFGRSWLAYRAAANDLDAAELDRDRFVATLAGTLAEAYFDAVSARRTLVVAQEQLRISQDLLEVIELRYDRAAVEGLDVLQQRSQAASAEAFVAQARMGVDLAEQRLAILMAQPPQSRVEGVAEVFPEVPAAPTVGTPASLVERRSDLVAARERLTAASQRTGAAYSAVLPTVSAQFDAGRDWFKTTETSAQNAWSAGGAIRVPIFNGGRGAGAIRSARAAEYSQAAAYGRLVLQAQGEVEAALAQEAAMAERLDAVQRQAELARLTFEQSQDRYLRGLDVFVNVLVAQNSLRQAEQSLVTAERDLLAARVALHTALGGPWTSDFGFNGDAR